MERKLAELAFEIEGALTLDVQLVARIKEALQSPGAKSAENIEFESTDQVLALVQELKPGWHIGIQGTLRLPNGHWRCTLRQSNIRDNDAYIGVGAGPTLPHALVASLLKVLAQSS